MKTKSRQLFQFEALLLIPALILWASGVNHWVVLAGFIALSAAGIAARRYRRRFEGRKSQPYDRVTAPKP